MTFDDVTKMALELSSQFEGHGFDQVTGNFDGQLLSCGALQWAWKQGTQQKLILKLEDLDSGLILKYMPTTGKRYLSLAQMPVTQTDSILECWSSGGRVFEPYFSELKALWGSAEMIVVQIYFAQLIAKKAESYCQDWSKAMGKQDVTIREFCFFFDLVVNNGSLLGLGYHDVSERILQNGQDQVIQEILMWCRVQKGDTVRNAQVWREFLINADTGAVYLFVLGWLRSLKSLRAYQGTVMNRRGTLALGVGYVNGIKNDFNNKYVGVWPGELVS